jgi:negative elongation factor A
LARLPAGRKEGGVKLLDIADQPLGYAQAKKRKKMQGIDYFFYYVCSRIKFSNSIEMEEAKKNTESAALQSPPPVTGTTPDYAAGLSSTPAYAPPTPQPILTPTSECTSNICCLLIWHLFVYFQCILFNQLKQCPF